MKTGMNGDALEYFTTPSTFIGYWMRLNVLSRAVKMVFNYRVLDRNQCTGRDCDRTRDIWIVSRWKPFGSPATHEINER